MVISGKTNVCAIIGNPVDHSLSPVMHNSAFNELGLDFVYVAFTVTAKELGPAISGARSMRFKGLNVTMPHKNTVINYLDKIDATAKNIGAVNTILCNKGCLIGYNTDGKGAIIALKENGIFPGNKKFVLLGAGGAGKAIAYQVAQDAGELVILNRTRKRAEKLAELLQKKFNKEVKGQALSSSILKKELELADVLINSTSVGMHPNVHLSPVPSDLLRSDLCVMDIIYNPLNTKLLKDAISVGAEVISGLEMLIHQGAVAFEIWTDCIAPVEVMRKAVLNQLEKQGVYL
jgi:shikimate dehydrogenase